ncbi:MAG TPA: tetratricopeptide repeat protein [Saprospiraceae bacterium]|nr:tetratricopeptide repeat protein [Saprospiraceae bacterium]HPN70441.1 tetratricopeptide repeat protein [Saprospiraceae bacterium]
MLKAQNIVIILSVVLVALLYFGFDHKPKNIKDLEKTRSQNLEATSIDNLLIAARDQLSVEQNTILQNLKSDADKVEGTEKADVLKNYASTWYDYGFPTISGYYAEEIAKLINDADSWSMAGTTYLLALKGEEDEVTKDFAAEKAVKAFENARSLDPQKVDFQINEALVYVERPLKEEPMKGILMLRDLNTKYPENTAVMNQLARLALQTNQLDRAVERLETVLKLEPENQMAHCLLAEVYDRKGNSELRDQYLATCNKK